MPFDHERFLALIGGACGAVFFAMVQFSATMLSGQSPSRQDIVRVVANIVLGICCGLIAAPILGPAIAPLIPLASLRDPVAVGFAIGGLAWEVAPFMIAWAKRLASERAQGKGQ